MIRVLYVCSAGGFGGSSRSLYEAITTLCKTTIQPFFLTKRGDASELYRTLSEEIIEARALARFDHTRASHYRGIRWLVILRELFNIPSTVAALRRAEKQWKSVDIIHINDITDIFTGIALKRIYQAPLIVHVRCMQIAGDRSLRGKLLKYLLTRYASAIIPIDENVASSLPDLPNITVIHNSFDGEKLDPGVDGLPCEVAWKIENSLKVGFLGNFYKSKGILELIEAARICRDSGSSIEYLMIGATPASKPTAKWRLLSWLGLAQDQSHEFERRLHAYNMIGYFHIIPRTRNIGALLRQIDVLVFPSHLNACGRSVFEAAYYAKPSVVAVDDPKADTLDSGRTGLAIRDPDPDLLADALKKLEKDRPLLREMGASARQLWEENFEPTKNMQRLKRLYMDLVP
jgi:glycosyltransferase involved in cell wall biosynthesis